MSNNNGFEQVGIELSESELALIHGGGFFGDVWDGIKKGANWVKNAAEDAYDWATSDTGKKVLTGAAVVIGAIFGGSSGSKKSSY